MNQLIKKLRKIPKSYFSLSDITKISALEKTSLRVMIHRLLKKGELLSAYKGIYYLPDSEPDLEALTCELGYPAYISLEWALAHHAGILHQMPYSMDLMTLGRTRSVTLADQTVKYHHLHEKYFWGYQQIDGKLVAEPEKAILDIMYLERLGLRKLQVDEIRWEEINMDKLLKYAEKTGKSYLVERVKGL